MFSVATPIIERGRIVHQFEEIVPLSRGRIALRVEPDASNNVQQEIWILTSDLLE
jgi:hypothetical protein